jgi:hypothetical protein
MHVYACETCMHTCVQQVERATRSCGKLSVDLVLGVEGGSVATRDADCTRTSTNRELLATIWPTFRSLRSCWTQVGRGCNRKRRWPFADCLCIEHARFLNRSLSLSHLSLSIRHLSYWCPLCVCVYVYVCGRCVFVCLCVCERERESERERKRERERARERERERESERERERARARVSACVHVFVCEHLLVCTRVCGCACVDIGQCVHGVYLVAAS